MKIITIGFSKSKKKFAIGSWVIRAYMGTPYSHTYLSFYSQSLDRHLKYEAVGSGVRFIGDNLWEKHALEIKSYTIEVTDESYIESLQECVDNAGINYGFWQNIGIVVANILNLNKNPFNSGINCSEIMGKLLKKNGYVITKDTNLLTPLDIENILKAGK